MNNDDNPFAQFVQGSSSVGSGSSSQSDDNPFAQFNANQTSGASPSVQPKQGAFWDSIDVMNRNFASIANGGLQLGAQALQAVGIDTSSFQKNIANQQAIHERDYQAGLKNSPIAGTITDIGSKIGAAIATPGSASLLGATGATALGRAGLTAAAGYNTGIQEYGTPEGKLQSGLLGAAGGAVGQIGGEVLGGVAKTGAGKLFSTPVQEAAQSFDQGLLTTVGAATGNKTIQSAEGVLGKLPYVGAARGINKNVNALKEEASSTLDSLGIKGQSNAEQGEELGNLIKNSKAEATLKTNAAYSKALDTATKNDISIPLTNTQKLATEALQGSDDLMKAGINSAGIGETKAGQLINDIANLPEGQIPAKVFEQLRKKVVGLSTNLVKGNDEEGLLPVIQKIKSSMDSDLDLVADTAGGQFGKEIKEARSIYMNEKAPFKDIPILDKSTSGKIDTDELLNQVVKNDRPQLTSKIMNVLSPEGKKSFTKSIVQKVVSQATDKADNLDLSKFTDGMHKLGETIDALPKVEQMKLKGLQKLLVRGDYLFKADKASATSLSNLALGGYAIGGTSLAGLPSMLGGAGITKIASMALTSPKVTKALIKLGGGKLAEKGQDGLIKSTLFHVIKRSAGNAASKATPMAGETVNAGGRMVVPEAAINSQ